MRRFLHASIWSECINTGEGSPNDSPGARGRTPPARLIEGMTRPTGQPDGWSKVLAYDLLKRLTECHDYWKWLGGYAYVGTDPGAASSGLRECDAGWLRRERAVTKHGNGTVAHGPAGEPECRGGPDRNLHCRGVGNGSAQLPMAEGIGRDCRGNFGELHNTRDIYLGQRDAIQGGGYEPGR